MIDDDNDEPSPEDVARMQAYLDHIEARINAPYDGVLGRLPDWVPGWHQNEFFKTRNSLLDGGISGDPVSHERIIEWMDAYCRLGNTPEGQVSRDYIPIERMKPIGDLAHYRYIVSLGPVAGLRALAGEKAVKGAQFSQGGTAKRGKEYEPKASIRLICEQIGSTEFDDVLEFLRDSDRCEDKFYSTIKPINAQFQVFDDTKTVEYVKRGEPPDSPRSIGFERLGNILREIKNDP